MESVYFSFHRSLNCFRLVSLIFIILATSSFRNQDNFDPLTTETYDQLEKRIKHSDDALLESYKFLRSLIKQINSQYNLSLTISEAAN